MSLALILAEDVELRIGFLVLLERVLAGDWTDLWLTGDSFESVVVLEQGWPLLMSL